MRVRHLALAFTLALPLQIAQNALAAKASALPYATMFISRHCARAPSASFTGGGPNMPTDRNDYVADPYPDFGAAPMMCTARGRRIIHNQGVTLRDTFRPDTKFSFIADVDQRDIDTANDYRDGIGGNAQDAKVRVVADLFSTMPKVCPYLDSSTAVDAEKRWIATLPRPKDFDNYVARLQQVTGIGRVGPLANIKSGVSKTGTWYGLENTVADIMENFHLESGAGIEVAWNRLEEGSEEYYKLMALRAYEFKGAFSPEYARRYISNIMYRIGYVFDKVSSAYPNSPTTEFLVGHDTDIITFGTVMDLAWNPRPLPVNSTTTSSSLRFDLFEASQLEHESPDVVHAAKLLGDQFIVQITYIYGTTMTDSGNLFQVPVTGPLVNDKGQVPLSAFLTQLRARIIKECTTNEANYKEYSASMLTSIRERLGPLHTSLRGIFTDHTERHVRP